MSGIRIRRVSVAAPAYNEAAGIEEIVCAWSRYLSGLPEIEDFEIVVCNDGSADETGKVLDRLAAEDPHCKPVHHFRNQGAAVALTAAIHATRFEWVLLIDSDGQYGIENVTRLASAVEAADGNAAIGVRLSKRDGIVARIGSRVSGSLCNFFHRTHYRDFNCALKLVSGNIVRSLSLEARGLNYSGEISSKLIERGVEMIEVPVEHCPRSSGRSSARTVRAAAHRLLFVFYIGVRQFLLRNEVLQVCRQ